MTTEILIEKIREELGSLDVPVEQAIAATVKILQNTNAALPPAEEKFTGRNITLEEYKTLPREEKRRYHDDAEKSNWRWVENQLNRLNAKWLMVVDGKVLNHGSTLINFPDRQELVELCKRTGKYPFAFYSPSMFAINVKRQLLVWMTGTKAHLQRLIRIAHSFLAVVFSWNCNLVLYSISPPGARKFYLLVRRANLFQSLNWRAFAK